MLTTAIDAGSARTHQRQRGSHNGRSTVVFVEEGLEGWLVLESRPGTQQERRRRYLDLAVEAESVAVKLSDSKLKAAWIDRTIFWMMIASEMSSENEGSGKRLFSGRPYWTAVK